MTVATDFLATRLQAAVGHEAVGRDPSELRRYAVDGKVPTIRCTPSDPGQIAAALRLCAEEGAAVIPWGGGTAIRLGNIPRRVDVVLSLERLNRFVEHDDANLTASLQAGMAVAAAQAILRQRNQFLAIDAPHPDRSTIGGVVSANLNGPRRMLYGGVRDLVLGMKMVLATGEQIKAGGKVVKNVAGYDMCKLFVGALGTLGIISEVTFKMAPLPETAASVVASGPLQQGAQLVDALMHSTLLPAAITILSSEAADFPALAIPTPAVAVWIEGFEEAVGRHLSEVRNLALRVGLRVEILRETSHQQLWDHVRDFGSDGKIVYRLGIPQASLGDVVASLERWCADDRRARYIAHAGTGTVSLVLDDGPTGAAWFPRLIALAQAHGGHAIMSGAPPTLKQDVDVWGLSPPGLAIMREIKRQFDPKTILNPGRFVAGL